MKKHLLSVSLVLLMVFISSFAFANVVSFNNLGIGINVNVIESRYGYTKIEYIFNGYETQEMKINGITYLTLSAPDLTWIMEKGNPQMLTHKRSLLIPDNSAMNYRIVSQEFEEINTLPIAPSKGHFTRDIDPNSVPYTFGSVYNTDKYFPENLVSFDSPYIVRDFRGMVVQFNPIQYNAVKGKMKVTKRLLLEVYTDNSKPVINPLIRQFPLTKVSTDFSELYRFLFMNYGLGDVRFDSIPEPGRMLVIYPAAYSTIAQQFVQWKQTRGMTVLTAEYPTQTGTGNTAIKTYIQNLYNTPEKITYIVLIGESYDIPTLNGVYEAAPSDPCYVKLAGTDAYPDAFISRISCQNATTMNYVVQKIIKFERDIQYGAAWYNKGTGIGGPDVGGSPPYADSIRMNWVRDTLMLGGFTQVDKCNGPAANATTLINFLNQGRYVLNYVGHGSGTSWSNTGFNTSHAYQLGNGWMNPYLCDVACLNGNFTLSECLNEALLRAGDTANPKGISTGYASSTNASWVPPCDMQLYANHLISRQFRKTAGAVSFFGVMYAMDKWGGSSGEGLKLMEQYNLLGDCSLLLTRGVPLGPSISHTQLPNTENLTGPYVVNCVINVANAPLKPNSTKLFWSRNNTVMTDSLLMTNTSGNNWSGNIPGNGTAALYRYCIKTIDTMNRVAI
ncbi:MAG: C25 family cysteine peptidase, partial [Ignavibacteria bacterium]|nr:C25 family cysteine peptidase [Ignavibacteria bacterium]